MAAGPSSGYETPLWTLIGVATGFGLSYLYGWAIERRQYTARTREAVERIKRTMHLSGSQEAVRRMADLVPRFRESEQIKILSEIGFESSLNASCDDVTQCVIEELRWACVLYELDRGGDTWVKKSRKDRQKVKHIQNGLWEILLQIVEYRQSEKLLRMAMDLLDALNQYSIAQGYREVIADSISIYRAAGALSIGVEYARSGYKVLNFRLGIDESIKRLRSLRDSVSGSSCKDPTLSQLSRGADKAIEAIETERVQRVP